MSRQAAANKASRPKRSKLGRDIIEELKLVEKHVKGEIELPVRHVEVPDFVDVKAVREKSGLTQAEFARRYGISPRSLQEWEQGRRQPEGAVRAYLLVTDRNPRTVEGELAKAAC
jgi:putative transcriptional regulator